MDLDHPTHKRECHILAEELRRNGSLGDSKGLQLGLSNHWDLIRIMLRLILKKREQEEGDGEEIPYTNGKRRRFQDLLR